MGFHALKPNLYSSCWLWKDVLFSSILNRGLIFTALENNCSQKDCVFSNRHIKVGGAMQKFQEGQENKPSSGKVKDRGETTPRELILWKCLWGSCCLLENKDSGKHSLWGSGEGWWGARPTLAIRGGAVHLKGNRNGNFHESLEKQTLGVESGPGEQAWDTGLGTAWQSLPLFLLSLPPLPLHTPPLLAKRTSLHYWRNGLETLRSLWKHVSDMVLCFPGYSALLRKRLQFITGKQYSPCSDELMKRIKGPESPLRIIPERR